ncbi:hypothetical protein [Streptomyces sp. NPDC005485]|uniref:hypothetical protein n=1 Tax=Streptomyces sp. NPDC005485 TaxID=3155591 RepID=UPI00339F3ACF
MPDVNAATSVPAQDSRLADSVVVTFAEIPSLAGRSFTGDWFAVDADRLPLFDRASYVDDNPDGYDLTVYSEQLVDGFHLLSLLDHLMTTTLRPDPGEIAGWNYVMDRVRFVSPVRAGERMRLTFEVLEAEPRGDGYLLLFDCVIEVENRTRPGFTARWRVLWLPAEEIDDEERGDD